MSVQHISHPMEGILRDIRARRFMRLLKELKDKAQLKHKCYEEGLVAEFHNHFH